MRLSSDLFEELRLCASMRAGDPAVLAPGREPLTFGGLWRQMQYVAGQVGGSQPIIAVILRNGPELLTALLGAMLAGAAAPLNPDLTTSEFRRQLTLLQPADAVLGPDQSEAVEVLLQSLGVRVWRAAWDESHAAGAFTLRQVPPAGAPRVARRLPPDTRQLMLTSGTTDQPKVAPLSGANLRAASANQQRCLGLTSADRLLSLLPLFHLYGFGCTFAQLAAGGSVVCTPGFDPQAFLGWLREFRPTWYAGGPALHHAVAALAASGTDLRCESLRLVRSSGAALPSSVHASLEQALGVPVLDSYGLTEADAVAVSPLPPLPRKPGSCGLSVGLEISILESDGRPLPPGVEGEIALRGPSVIAGYLDDPVTNGECFRDGWLLTGDLGRLDEEGYLFITGRRKEMINRGGEKVMPAEIETALLAHPAVSKAAAFKVPHPSLGEEPEAAVVLHAGAQVTESQLRAHAAELLAGFKVPRRIHITSEIPYTSTGKPRRAELSARFERASEGSHPAPRSLSPAELRIAVTWSRVLGRQELAPDDDFFELGGDSLSAAVILAEAQAEFGVTTPLFAFFEKPTIEHLARLVTAETAHSGRSTVVHLSGQGEGIPVFCIPTPRGDPYYLRHLAARMDRRRPFFALLMSPRPAEAGAASLEEIARTAVADLRAASPRGPYLLAGHCFGGVVAFEAARQMRAAGDEVQMVILLDSPTPGYPKIHRHWSRYAPAAWGLLREAGAKALVRQATTHVRMLLPIGRRAWLPGQKKRSAISRILHSYVPKPLDVPVVQVLATGHPMSTRVFEDFRLGWREFACAGFTVVSVPGDHQSFLQPPHIDETVRHLQAILNPTAQ